MGLGLQSFIIIFVLQCFTQQFAECRIWNVTASGTLGGRARLQCIYDLLEGDARWYFEGNNLQHDDLTIKITQKESQLKDEKDNDVPVRISTLSIEKSTLEYEGNYTCSLESNAEMLKELKLNLPAKVIDKQLTPFKVKAGASVQLFCVFEGHDLSSIKWKKQHDMAANFPQTAFSTKRINATIVMGYLNLTNVARTDNGTYLCGVFDPGLEDKVVSDIDLLVLDTPQVSIDFIRGIESRRIFLNWTVNDGNSPVEFYTLQYRKNGTEAWTYTSNKVGGGNTSFIIDGLDPSTFYQIRISAKNAQGMSQVYTDHRWVSTLAKDVDFVPVVHINGLTLSSGTIGWNPPPEEVMDNIHYYELEATKKDGNISSKKEAIHSGDNGKLLYLFEDLEPATTYIFRVRACSEYTRTCGNWSEAVNGTTNDSTSGPPKHVSIQCHIDKSARVAHVGVRWEHPLVPNGKVIRYNVELQGQASFVNSEGVRLNATWGPKIKSAGETARSTRFENLPVNTNYTVWVSGVTRTKRPGVAASASCTAPPGPPSYAELTHYSWYKISNEDGRYLFKMKMPKLSERNGAICCYRVVMIRLAEVGDPSALPQPYRLQLTSYQQAHSSSKGGAYLAEIFDNISFPQNEEILLGDGASVNSDNERLMNSCDLCLQKLVDDVSSVTTTTERVPIRDDIEAVTSNGERGEGTDGDTAAILADTVAREPREAEDSEILMYDGPVRSDSNYSAAIQFIVMGAEGTESVWSDYMRPLRPAATTVADPMELVLKIICGLLGLTGVALAAACALISRRRKPTHNGSISDTLRSLYRGLKGRGSDNVRATLTVPPIPGEMLPSAYLLRSADSDLGFQREFEMLPDSFPDRTTHASEARENQSKNRYPDIKAYDQTRVKLNPMTSVPGSDYINANYVNGYKESHRYICAQGPTDATVNDFWRMIWEQGVEVVVMLTNLEEYSKVKCTKYWPDEATAKRNFSNITVEHLGEKRYADYVVRELKVSRHVEIETESPSLENDQLCKRNGSIGGEERIVRQFHYLMWKDFVAPDYPYAVLHFLKRLDEAGWCNNSGGVVHCSAGVGRTGTLVALHALSKQLDTQKHVTVHSTVAALRSQRNYLVQSLKQYIFIYRALVELAYYGDTEIAACQLKSTIDRLRTTPEGAAKSLMEDEFEKMLNPPLPEPVKSCSAASSEENRSKNRPDAPLPFDRNRVILSPVPGRDFSTYINASFIQGYDNSECFIITQDPLPTTISDFWRMISEQEVTTIVMLSELGEGERKCPRYWDDGTVQYDHISVEYSRSESCPYYTKREFQVTNTKSQERLRCVQYQYHGWPTVSGQVPEVTRGLCELAEATRECTQDGNRLVAHCARGGERAALYVALSLLIQELRLTQRLDVASTARKLTQQRDSMIETFLQYEFLYRAILNYAELHNLVDETS